MYILSFILLLFGLVKVLAMLTKKDISDTISTFPAEYESAVKAIICAIAIDGLLEIICSLFILIIL